MRVRYGRAAVAAIAIALIPVLRGLWRSPPTELRGDSIQYVRSASNLLRHHVYSRAPGDESAPPAPDAYREPAYPVFLAAALSVWPGSVVRAESLLFERGDDDDYLKANPTVGRRFLQALSRSQLLLAFATCVLTGVLALRLGATRLTAGAAMLFIGLSETSALQTAAFWSESLAAPLLIAVSLAVRRSIGGSTRWIPATGVLLALLALTRASNAYLAPCLALLLVLAQVRAGMGRRHAWVGAALMLAAFSATLSPWLLRNWLQFGRLFIAERGGLTLSYRAEYSQMSRSEWGAAFLYLIPSPGPKALLQRALSPAAYNRLDRENPTGFYQSARQRRAELYELTGDPRLSDKRQLQEAVSQITRSPVRYLVTTLPLAWGGIFIERGVGPLNASVFPDLPALLNPLLFGAFLWVAWRAARARDTATLLLMAPFAYGFVFHAMLSNSIPRYNEVMLPILWAAASLALSSAGGALLRSVRRTRTVHAPGETM